MSNLQLISDELVEPKLGESIIDKSPSAQIDKIEAWLKENPDLSTLTLANTSESDFHNLESSLSTRGVKLRYSWCSQSKQLVVSMPHPIHEVLTDWVCEHKATLQEVVQGHNICDTIEPDLWMSGPSDYGLAGYVYQPDQGICVLNKKTMSWVQGGFPLTVFEVANSQTREAAKTKAWRWLWDTDYKVQAVVIYNLQHPISKKPFRADISVWVRSSDDIDVLYPLDNCGGGNQSSSPDLPRESSVHDNNPLYFRPSNGWAEMVCRDGPVVVIDEAAESGDSSWKLGTLKFSVFDFARMCRRKQDQEITDKIIELDLVRLREGTMAHVNNERKLQEEREELQNLEHRAKNASPGGASEGPSSQVATRERRKRPAPAKEEDIVYSIKKKKI